MEEDEIKIKIGRFRKLEGAELLNQELHKTLRDFKNEIEDLRRREKIFTDKQGWFDPEMVIENVTLKEENELLSKENERLEEKLEKRIIKLSKSMRAVQGEIDEALGP